MKLADKKQFASCARLCACFVGLIEILRIYLLARLPDGELVRNIPDDAFYYLQAARNFARLGRWTFDGVEPSSGFHLIWGYVLSVFFLVAPRSSFHTVFVVASVMESACLVLAAFLLTKTVERFAGGEACGGVLLVFLSASSLLQGTWLMESGPTIAANAAVLYFVSAKGVKRRRGVLILGFFLGCLASFCRSDAGLLTFWLLVINLYSWRKKGNSPSTLVTSASCFVGAASGVVATSFHTHWVSRQWLQASAQQKLFWSHISGWSMLPGMHVIYNLFNPLNNAYSFSEQPHQGLRDPHLLGKLVAASTVAWLTLLILLGLRRGLGTFRRTDTLEISAAALLTLLSYCVFYGYDSSALQPWYVGNYQVPVALLAGIGLSWFFRRYALVSVAVLIVMSAAGTGFSMRRSSSSPKLEAIWRAGVYFKTHPEIHPIGAWNAGSLGYFADNGVINIDGLMNDAILPYTKTGTLENYLVKRKIIYIFDSPRWWEPSMAVRGGYSDGLIHSCIIKSENILPNDPDNNPSLDPVFLYTLDIGCMAANSHATGQTHFADSSMP